MQVEHVEQNDFVFELRAERVAGDEDIILGTWLRHVRTLYPLSGLEDSQYKKHADLIGGLVRDSRVLVACSTNYEDSVFGWVCFEPDVLHMVYVRNPWRRRGVGTALMQSAFPQFGKQTIQHTHIGRATRHLRSNWRLKWNPYLVTNGGR